MDPAIYTTSYCNKGHNLKTGRPINHECRIIPPSALRAERAGNYAEAQGIMSARPARVVVGRGARKPLPDTMAFTEREKLSGMLATLLGCDWQALRDICRGARVETKAGVLRVHFDAANYGAIFCRFEAPDAARKVLHGDAQVYPGGGQRLNPYSGKWNFHFGKITAEQAYAVFEYEYRRLLTP